MGSYKNQSDIPSFGKGLVQRLEVAESTQHKRVNQMDLVKAKERTVLKSMVLTCKPKSDATEHGMSTLH